MNTNSPNLERTYSLFVTAGVILIGMTLLLTNMPELQISNYVDIPFRRQISGGLYVLGSLLGYMTWRRYVAHQESPWKVPHSQVSILFTALILVLGAATLLSK